MPHNPILTIRQNLELDKISAIKDSDPVVSEIGLLTGVIPYISQFVDIAKQTSQSVLKSPIGVHSDYLGLMAVRPDHVMDPILREAMQELDITDTYPKTVEMPRELCTPEQIADAEAAIQEASEGKLDYLLEGTQWDPRNRK